MITKWVRLDQARAEFIRDFLERSDVVQIPEASLQNVSRRQGKLQYRLRQNRFRTWKKLCEEMTRAGFEKTCSWGHFYGIVKGPQYEVMTADTCCCGVCRDLGFQNYAEARMLVEELRNAIELQSDGVIGLANKQELLKRLIENEEFYKGLFQSHINVQGHDPEAAHCCNLLLSSFVDQRFAKPCPNRKVGPTWSETVFERKGRAARSQDWSSVCNVCYDPAAATSAKKRGLLYTCRDCNLSAHELCIEQTHWDLPEGGKRGTGDWVCWECVQDIDTSNHKSDCGQCHEFDFLFGWIGRGVSLLKSLEEHNGTEPKAEPPATATSRNGLESEMLGLRLRLVERNHESYRSHLIRDANSKGFERLVLEEGLQKLDVASFYAIQDYWAKWQPRKAGGTACCEGDQVGISAHGMLFIYKNPTRAEREAIDKKFGNQPWENFGPAGDEDGAPHFLEEVFDTFADDAKQTTFHTKSNMEATIAVFLAGRPWLAEERRAFIKSDGASNYKEPTTELDIPVIGTRLISVEGEGKGRCDADDADVKRGFYNRWNQGESLETAVELCRVASTMGLPGHTFAVLHLDRSLDETGVKGRVSIPEISKYSMWTVDEEGTLTFFESLDHEASRVSMLEKGRATGMGTGLEIKLDDFNAKHRKHTQNTEASLAVADGGQAAPKPHFSIAQKQTMAAAKADRSAEQRQRRDRRLAAQIEIKKSQYEQAAFQCPKCAQTFLLASHFRHHKKKDCINKVELAKERLRTRDVSTMLALSAEAHAENYRERIANLRTVVVKLKLNGSNGNIGIELEESPDHGTVVKSLDVNGLAFQSAQIQAGWILEAARTETKGTVAAVESEGELVISTIDITSTCFNELKLMTPSQTLVITFRLPAPDIPLHGIARKGLHKGVQFKFHEEQLAWLGAEVFADGKEKMRDKQAYETMRAHFDTRVRTDVLGPMWAPREQIAKWLADQKKIAKAARKAKKAGHGIEREDAGQQSKKARHNGAGKGDKAAVKGQDPGGQGKGKRAAAASGMGENGPTQKLQREAQFKGSYAAGGGGMEEDDGESDNEDEDEEEEAGGDY